jgi:hypothetical protein
MIVVHIGLRKAGSTTIQHFLNDNEDALARMGIEYPRIGRQKRVDHNNLSNELRERRAFDAKYGTMAELQAFWNNSPSSTLIVSAETFEECTHAQCLRLKRMLDRNGEEFRIVLILRDLLDLMISSYAQKIKFGENTYDFDTFFEDRITNQRVNYARTARIWAKIFGWESLRIRLLDRRYLVNGDLIDDFLTVLDLDLESDKVRALSRKGPVNVSPGWRVIEAVRALYLGRAGLPPGHPLNKCNELTTNQRRVLGANALDLGGELGWNKDRGAYLTLEQAQKCFVTNREAMRHLNSNIAEPLPLPMSLVERGFTPRGKMPDVSDIPRKELRQFYNRLGAMPLTWRAGIY